MPDGAELRLNDCPDKYIGVLAPELAAQYAIIQEILFNSSDAVKKELSITAG